ncbi:hypothetical protein NDU88_005104 [Pleurodeles waltl]|uniref:Uncharacterized protein n=1 Tax=Pleurodeles waltl TaxID=8319 RepID=A0AAV7MVB9_PLEWA|nr:hypothetical protein NDU88_005104 [Pleurodeles waltl]
MALPGTRRDLVDSTQEGESEGALSNSESLQKTKQHAQESHSMGTKKVQKEAHTSLQQRIPCRRRTTQEDVRCRIECWGQELDDAQRTSWKDANKPCQLQNMRCMGYCLVWGGKLLPPPKLDSRPSGPSGPLQSTTRVAGSTHTLSGEETHAGNRSREVPAEAGE